MIENNTLTLDQVTAIIDGKRILGNPNEFIRDTLKNTDQVDDSVQRMLSVMGNEALSATEIMKRLELSHRPTEYNGPAEPVRQFMLSQAPNSTEPHTESG